jgi:hypothetical protein
MGKIVYAGKVLPVQEAFRTQQWILPTQHAIQILREARVFALVKYTCRSHCQRCSHPLETRLLINNMADTWVTSGKARLIPFEEAEDALRNANRYGLVHQIDYEPDYSIWAIGGCCIYCCYRL